MLGTHSSVAGLASQVADKAAGNPFFTEEIVRDLAERGVLDGDPGAYVCRGDITSVSVPPTVQATIAARIDRLGAVAKETLNAAAVIGSRFDEETLNRLLDCIDVAELVEAELIDQVKAMPRVKYAFRHPLIRTVAYESQLKSERADLHRRLAAAIEQRDPGSVEENAALIATHLEAAGDLRQAFAWHMRAVMWSTYRDIGAARVSWKRARQVADRMPAADTDRLAIRIAPPTPLCGTFWEVGGSVADPGFDEIRALTTAAGDKRHGGTAPVAAVSRPTRRIGAAGRGLRRTRRINRRSEEHDCPRTVGARRGQARRATMLPRRRRVAGQLRQRHRHGTHV